ncbi:class I adenylate-forming enzyme family protein [Yinghuangia seranimata]|uniref:class I adenylate-forming enzyme family protein n=1 Tax=Yinghuangia seranimata TaxID=408067 RepID=UPI00248C4916|nr:AMP-binding protein [Yinghuangia seranimata]MDI2129959.1 AMP-binding protein [Yinghuangia seranimata]MDI2131637.1 AMP-binding protein [Yinghuangia seranimata]
MAAALNGLTSGNWGHQVHGQDIPWLLRHWAEHRPEHPALVWEPAEGERRTWTYAELLADTLRVAAGLHARGVGREDKVLVHADNCPEMLVAWLACATVGAVAVTTNTHATASELAYFAEHTHCTTAITQPRFLDLIAESGADLRWTAVIGADDAAALPEGAVPFAELYGDADAYPGRPIEPLLPFGIMFTSGTTSRPKGVVHTHANAVWASRSGPRSIDLGPDDRYLIYLPLFHVNAQSWSMFSVLGVGATAVLMPKWSTSRFWDVVVRNGITHISLMPFAMGTLAAKDRPESKLRVGVFGMVNTMLDKMLGLKVYGAYGMTETVIHAITGKPSEHLPAKSMGRPAPGYGFKIVDRDTGEECGVGEQGELWLHGERGVQFFLEYYGNAEATEKAFEGDWFKTGDMVALGEGGNVFYRERDKDLLKVGGENVSAREVEDLILTVPGVGSVAVVGKKHDFLDEVVVAFVIRNAAAPEAAELEKAVVELCRAKLSDFKVPRAVYFVDAFPTGTLDKILKKELREMADAQPAV